MAKPDKAQPEERLRQEEALRLRIGGASYAQIAAKLGYADHSGAFRAVEAVLDRQESHAAESLRQIENGRLDLLWRKAFAAAMDGNATAEQRAKAEERALRVHHARVKLHGLAMPEKLVVAAAISSQQSSGMTAEEFRDVVLELQRRHPAKPRPGYVPEPLPPGEMPRWQDDAWELGFDPSMDTPLVEDDGKPWANT
ncbi:hypothetical protein [Nocardia wallacei]|uniref:hypothetical protein n=1 Tax=Nocardia wallacei TaxID=480035 RepID=UPI0024576AC7|nr:hypothetical protein [Nocardia wallacei]